VIAQTLSAHEIILVDDYSNDGGKTLSELEQLQSTYQGSSIKVLQLGKNSGPGSARNAGWESATQPYIAFLDADDTWHPAKLEIQYEWMAAHPHVVLTGHPSVKISVGEALPALPDEMVAYQVNRRGLLLSNCFPTRSVMLKRNIPYRFIPEKRYAEDYMLWLTIVFRGLRAYYLNKPMASSYKEEFGEGGLTGNLWKAERGVLDTYKRLLSNGSISTATWVLISSFSLLKYLRRWIIVKARALNQNIFCVARDKKHVD
jgi:glycosyltransferase involved in cell wall biosynthesis